MTNHARMADLSPSARGAIVRYITQRGPGAAWAAEGLPMSPQVLPTVT
jgi:hypothetical protein